MTDFIVLVIYFILTISCIYLGILFFIWSKIATSISTIWKYQMVLFFAIGYSKIYLLMARYFRGTNIIIHNHLLDSWEWITRDIPLLIVIGWFVWEMSKRFFILRKREK